MQNTVDHTSIADLARLIGVGVAQHGQAEEVKTAQEAHTATVPMS